MLGFELGKGSQPMIAHFYKPIEARVHFNEESWDMKYILILSLLMTVKTFASAEEDSDALSKSFNTVPLGRTTHGFVTVKSESEISKFNDSEKERNFLCQQDHDKCSLPEPKKAPPPKMGKKSFIEKMPDVLLE